MNVKTEAAAFRIWQYAEPLGWNVTLREVAEKLGIAVTFAGRVAAQKGWSTRFRAPLIDNYGFTRTPVPGPFGWRDKP